MNYDYKIKYSNVLKKLRRGDVVSCIKLSVSNIRAFELAAMHGFDCIWTDMEHVSNDWGTIEGQIFASKLYDVDIVVRISKRGYNDYIKPLEMDATGIMVPHVMNYEDAIKVVEYSRFHPLGNRAMDGGNADGKYCNLDFDEYINVMNTERFIIAQIEDQQAVDHIEEICSIEGIDIIFFGPGDYALSKGIKDRYDHEIILDARKKVVDTAKKHNKFAGTVAIGNNIEELLDLGYKFISVGSDVAGLNDYYKRQRNIFDDIVNHKGHKK